jgi:signal transduction histidine kinase
MNSTLTDVLIHLSDAVGNADTLPELYDAALAGVRHATGVDRVAILLFEDDGVMRFKAWSGLSDSYRTAVEGHTPWAQGSPPPDPIVIEDVTVDASLAGYREMLSRECVHSLAFVPIISRRQVVGKFMLYSDRPDKFEGGEITATLTIGYQIGFAIERMRSLKAEAEVRERLTVLTDASERLLTSVDVTTVVDEIVSLARQVLAADAYAVWRRSENSWRIAASRDLSEAFTSEVLEDEGRVNFTAPLVVEDVTHSIPLESRRISYTREGIHSLVSIPMIDHGRPSASLVLYYRTPYKPTELELQVALALSQLAAAAMRNARLLSEAQEGNRLKDEFLATLSHELRTPLNVILGRTQLLRTGSLDAGAVSQTAETIARNGQLLARLVDDLLDVSRITLGQVRLDPQPLLLDSVIATVTSGLEPTARARAITISVQQTGGRVTVLADATRLQQVVWNLLTNAIKFTPPGGHVRIAIEQRPSHAALIVTDNGAGIPRAFLPHVFEMFRQAESAKNRQYGGLGLGLSIVRRLVELHGGSVTVESDGPGRGTAFTVLLPLPVASVGGGAALVDSLKPLAIAPES